MRHRRCHEGATHTLATSTSSPLRGPGAARAPRQRKIIGGFRFNALKVPFRALLAAEGWRAFLGEGFRAFLRVGASEDGHAVARVYLEGLVLRHAFGLADGAEHGLHGQWAVRRDRVRDLQGL